MLGKYIFVSLAIIQPAFNGLRLYVSPILFSVVLFVAIHLLLFIASNECFHKGRSWASRKCVMDAIIMS